MPKSAGFGGAQLITFAVQQFAGSSGYIWINARKGQTCAQIAAQRGHPEERQLVASLNHVAAYYRFKHPRRIKLPATLKAGDTFDVMGDDMAPPVITDGYAILQVVARPGMVGVAQFMGYNPLAMDVPIRFEATNKADGSGVESDIATLERMAGRGNFAGSGQQAPPVIRLSTTDNAGNVVPLIPLNYQWNIANAGAPLWRVESIKWDTKPWRNRLGRRIRQTAVVTMWEYTPITLQVSLSQRAAAKARHKAATKARKKAA
jgi:hypothetical protein